MVGLFRLYFSKSSTHTIDIVQGDTTKIYPTINWETFVLHGCMAGHRMIAESLSGWNNKIRFDLLRHAETYLLSLLRLKMIVVFSLNDQPFRKGWNSTQQLLKPHKILFDLPFQ